MQIQPITPKTSILKAKKDEMMRMRLCVRSTMRLLNTTNSQNWEDKQHGHCLLNGENDNFRSRQKMYKKRRWKRDTWTRCNEYTDAEIDIHRNLPGKIGKTGEAIRLLLKGVSRSTLL
ncbi:hypothetical protein V1478_005177 [Vespula squamosa]|uniref:Uncharacterized protein n=1 Tax=Vespula squamosa TaxID=30214 RepID=A0ABD2BDE0_VESSQ